jgi:PAS domain S-box-containing protein
VTQPDSSQWMQPQEPLQVGEEQFRLLVDGVKDYAIFMLTPDGRVATWNQGAERIKGYRADEIIGRHFSSFYSTEDKERGKPEAELRIAAAEGRYEEEGWRLRKDGSQFWASVVITALHDSEGTLRGFGKVTRDMTERKRAEEERSHVHAITHAALARLSLDDLLRELLGRIRGILAADTAVILLLEGDALVTRAAEGLDVEQAIRIPLGSGFAGRIAAAGQPAAVEDVSQAELVSPALRRSGVRSLLGAPLMVEGRVIGVLHVGTLQPRRFTPDETRLLQVVADRVALAVEHARLYEQVQRHAADLEQRIAERTTALEEANAELQAFSYTVSHDLLAPLRYLQGFTDALLEDYVDQLDGMGQEYVRRISAAAQRMDSLIRDLLAYSRLGRAELDLRPLDLETLVEEVVAGFDEELRSREAGIEVRKPMPPVIAHRSMLVQVVQNLITNAVKFGTPGVPPRVHISTEKTDRRVRLWVEDNGIGIAPEHQSRIFRVFERLHGGETYPGTGIGLAIVRRAVERMDGSVGVQSEPGQGSRFWIELPQAEHHER